MVDTLQRFGAGVGIPLGAGIAATAALLSGVGAEYGVVVAFGVVGGLVVGGFAGQFAEGDPTHERWALRLVAFTLLVSLLAGSLLGLLTAWTVDGSLSAGVAVGSAAGGAFSLLLSGVLFAEARSDGEQTPPSDTQPGH
jgi:hypothetical protein